MMKRRSVLKLMAAPALMTIARPGFAKEKITYAYLLDPAYDAVTWAMSNGKVKSDRIKVEARRPCYSAAHSGYCSQAVRCHYDGGDRDSASQDAASSSRCCRRRCSHRRGARAPASG